MSTAAPSKNSAPLVPPDEQFWKRYSPHGEAPLSMSGSLAVHVLAGGALVLIGIYLASYLSGANHQLPVEPVRMKIDGGGGGRVDGGPKGKAGGGFVEDAGGEKSDDPQAGQDDGPRKPALDTVAQQKLDKVFDDPTKRFLAESTAAPVKRYANLEQGIRNKLALADRSAAKGQGGSGEGGGKGSGKGSGEGAGEGPGKATLNKREKRMLRWNMVFTANTGPEYLAQMKGLGAILAFPVTEGPEPQYKVVRDLVRGGKMLDEDVSKIQQIYWIDDKPRSVTDILGALGIRMQRIPSRFVAFMPLQLEQELFEMEKRYVEKTLRSRFDEDRIDETRFSVVFRGRKYQPQIVSVTLKP